MKGGRPGAIEKRPNPPRRNFCQNVTQKKKSEKYCGCVAEGVGGSSGQWAGAVGCLDTAVSSFLFFEKWPFARVLVL